MPTNLSTSSTKPKTQVGKFNSSKYLAKKSQKIKPSQNRIPKMQPLPYQMFADNSPTKSQNKNSSSNLNDNNEQEEYNDDSSNEESNFNQANYEQENQPQTIQGQINKDRNLSQQQQQGEEENNEAKEKDTDKENSENNEENENEESDEDKYIDQQNKEVDEYNEQNPDGPQKIRYPKNLKHKPKKDNTIKEDPKKQAFTKNFLRQAYFNVIPTFGASLLYVWFHFTMRYVAGATTYFCKFGVLEPLPPQVTDSKFYKENRSTSKKIQDTIKDGFGAEYFEIIGAVLSFIFVLFSILILIAIFALVVGVLFNPWKSAWEALKLVVKAYLLE